MAALPLPQTTQNTQSPEPCGRVLPSDSKAPRPQAGPCQAWEKSRVENDLKASSLDLDGQA